MRAMAVQICGTGSGVGKSVITAGLCRIFLQDGYKVAPFKAQNMSLNSFVTSEGGEMGRAQVVQAAACRLSPSVDMNPVLLKPSSDVGSQVIVQGKPVGNMSAVQYKNYKSKVRIEVMNSFNRLRKGFDVIVIEGAGSPAEVNLKAHDIVNMNMARAAGSGVIIVGDIDKGGVFAWLVGTLELLTRAERKMVKGFIINRFRGDKTLLQPGIDFLEKRTGIKVLGVIPYFKDIKLPDEDSVPLELNRPSVALIGRKTGCIDIAVIKLPHISNFTDFDPLKDERSVKLRYVGSADELDSADIIIIPGTKNVFSDLKWLRKVGLSDKILKIMKDEPSTMLMGICGGYQMLGQKIRDSHNLESRQREIAGLGILPVTTVFGKEKVLSQVMAEEIGTGLRVSGYEIHHGRTKELRNLRAAFRILRRQGEKADSPDGSVSKDGRVLGTYIHGIFDEGAFRVDFINRSRARKGLRLIANTSSIDLDAELDKLARLLRQNLDIPAIRDIMLGSR